jgi:RimJ/RimL family protein N-acetyltransferase
MGYEIGPVSDEEALAALLGRDRYTAAYALCDLDPPYRENTRFIGATIEGELRAVLLLYGLPTASALNVYGSVEGAAAIFEQCVALPRDAFLILSPEHVRVVTNRYAPRDFWHVLRMVLKADELVPPPPVQSRVARLGTQDVAAMSGLYGLWEGKGFSETMLSHELYFGAFEGDRLVAIAGTHTVSRIRDIAAIGGVFTHPHFRGRGLATRLTGAVCQAVTQDAIELIVLNVIEDNVPAIAAYTRLGFSTHCRLFEGPAVLKGYE